MPPAVRPPLLLVPLLLVLRDELLEPPPLFFFPLDFVDAAIQIPPGRMHCERQAGIPRVRPLLRQRMSLSWIALVVAGLLEVCWAVGLKYTDGFRRPLPSLLVIAAIAASMFLLSWAARTLPIGTAYAVWVGIGAFGAAILGIVLFHEPVTAARVGFLALLLVAIVGLKATA